VLQLVLFRSIPAPPTVTIVNPPGEDNPVAIRYVSVSCPAETYPEYRARYSIDEGALGSWSSWSTTPSTTASMWFGEKLVVEVEARCISDWTPKIPGTEGPPATTVNPPWIRPIPVPDAPLNVKHDNGGTSVPKADRVLWDAVVCPTNTTVSYIPQRDGSGVGWQDGLTYNVATAYGTRYTYTVIARCSSPYTTSPNSAQSNETGWTTPIPAPSTASLWVSVPGSAYAGDWFSVNAGGSTCAWPSNTFYDFTNSRDGLTPTDRLVGGRGNANTSDYWSSTGYVTYSVRIQCRTADAVSPWSGWKSDGINIVNPPAPPAPGSVGSSSGSWTRYCGNSGFQGTADWAASSGASSYNVQVNWTQVNGQPAGWTGAGTTGATSLTVNQSGSVANNPQIQLRVQAVGAGGTSAWSQVPISASLGCF